MSHPVYYVPAGDVIPVFFATYAGATGASATLTGLAVTDIEIYKDGSTTQRASDNGYTLIDTDGIDVDGTTGIHGFTIDTGDNSDASFYTTGAWFTVVVSSVTVDSQTVNFIACQFRIMEAETTAGRPLTQTAALSANAITATSINADAITDAKVASDVTIASVTGSVGSVAAGGIAAASFAAGAIDASAIAANAIGASEIADGAIDAGAIAADAITAAKIADGAIDAATFAAGAITATVIATGAIDADALAADAGTELATALLDATDGVESSVTVRQAMRLILSAAAAKLSGAATTTVVIRDVGDTKDRITATVDANGNRTAVTLDAT